MRTQITSSLSSLKTWIPPNVLCRSCRSMHNLISRNTSISHFTKEENKSWNYRQWVTCLRCSWKSVQSPSFLLQSISIRLYRFVYRFSVPNFVIISSPLLTTLSGSFFSCFFILHYSLLWRYIDCYVCSINVAITNVFGSRLSNIKI